MYKVFSTELIESHLKFHPNIPTNLGIVNRLSDLTKVEKIGNLKNIGGHLMPLKIVIWV